MPSYGNTTNLAKQLQIMHPKQNAECLTGTLYATCHTNGTEMHLQVQNNISNLLMFVHRGSSFFAVDGSVFMKLMAVMAPDYLLASTD